MSAPISPAAPLTLAYPPISQAAAQAMGNPLFVPNPDSPLFSGTSSKGQPIPQTELQRETEAFDMAERDVDAAIIAQALRESKNERDRVAKINAQKTQKATTSARKNHRKRKAQVDVQRIDVAGSDDEDSDDVVAVDLKRFGEEMDRDKRGTTQERKEWPEFSKLDCDTCITQGKPCTKRDEFIACGPCNKKRAKCQRVAAFIKWRTMKTMQITEEQFEQLLAAFKPKSKASSPTKRRKVQTEPLTIRLPSMLGEPGKEKGKQRESWSGGVEREVTGKAKPNESTRSGKPQEKASGSGVTERVVPKAGHSGQGWGHAPVPDEANQHPGKLSGIPEPPSVPQAPSVPVPQASNAPESPNGDMALNDRELGEPETHDIQGNDEDLDEGDFSWFDDYSEDTARRTSEREMEISFHFWRAHNLLDGVLQRIGLPPQDQDAKECREAMEILKRGADEAFYKAYEMRQRSETHGQPFTFHEWVSSTNRLVVHKRQVLNQLSDFASGPGIAPSK